MDIAMGKVFIVFCVDTEGPYTDPSYYDPKQLLSSWKDIDRIFLSKVFSEKFRYSYPDSHGNPFVMSWFILNWVGHRTYPVKHDVGYHKIYDHYIKRWGKEIKKYKDEIGWHFHIPAPSGIGNEWGTDWLSTNLHTEILSRMLVDRNFFPNIFRAGGTIEDNIQSNWLENWIPFDYSNRNDPGINWGKKEADGRKIKELLPWEKAPTKWQPYHPSERDLTRHGSMKRLITKSLDLKSGVHTMTKGKVLRIFRQVKNEDIIFSVFDHDFRERESEISEFLSWITEASKKTSIKFVYAGAGKAMKLYYKWPTESTFKLTIKRANSSLIVKSNKELFNKQPFLAIKFDANNYKWSSFFKIGEGTWIYNLLPKERGKTIGIAAHDKYGNTFTKLLNS